MKREASYTPVAICTLALAQTVLGKKEEEEVDIGDWLLQHIILILGIGVLVLVFLWCICSIHAGRTEKKAQELRRQNRAEQEEEELTIQTSLYNRQEEQQRKILQILSDRLNVKMREAKSGGKVLDLPNFISE